MNAHLPEYLGFCEVIVNVRLTEFLDDKNNAV